MHVKQLFDLSGKVAMVTGGSRGLGLEIATGLGEAGAAVVVTARRAQWLASAEQELTALGITHLADDLRRLAARSSQRSAVGRFCSDSNESTCS